MPYDMQKLKRVPIAHDDEGNPIYNLPREPKKAKTGPKKMKQPNPKKAGSYLTTRGQKKKLVDKAFDYTME